MKWTGYFYCWEGLGRFRWSEGEGGGEWQRDDEVGSPRTARQWSRVPCQGVHLALCAEWERRDSSVSPQDKADTQKRGWTTRGNHTWMVGMPPRWRWQIAPGKPGRPRSRTWNWWQHVFQGCWLVRAVQETRVLREVPEGLANGISAEESRSKLCWWARKGAFLSDFPPSELHSRKQGPQLEQPGEWEWFRLTRANCFIDFPSYNIFSLVSFSFWNYHCWRVSCWKCILLSRLKRWGRI